MDDEIEILEIVGLDEDAPPLGLSAEDPDDEIVLDLEDEEAGAADPERAAPRLAQPVDSGDVEDGDGDASQRERLVRLQADFENYKKRSEKEKVEFQKHASAALVRRLLPVLDNFERAVAAESSNGGDAALRDGLILMFRQMLEELRREGLTAVDSVGQTFDPNVHEAVATDGDSQLPSNTVVEELQRGYILHGRLLRPALVKVSTGGVDADDPVDDA